MFFFAIQRNNEQIIRTQDKVNLELAEMKNKMTGIERKQDRMQVRFISSVRQAGGY